MFSISELDHIKIKEINSSLKSILYNPSDDIERYKIIYLSENFYYIFKYTYGKDLKCNYKKITLFRYNKKDEYSYYDIDINLIKKINSLLFICGNDTFTISKKNNLDWML